MESSQRSLGVIKHSIVYGENGGNGKNKELFKEFVKIGGIVVYLDVVILIVEMYWLVWRPIPVPQYLVSR